MRIQTIQGKNYTTNNNSKTSLNTYPVSVSKNNTQAFGSMGQIWGANHGGSGGSSSSWSAGKLRILERSEMELRDLAEYFHNCTESEITTIAEEAHWISSTNARTAANKLFNAVKKIQSEKRGMGRSELKRLAEKAANRSIFLS